MYMAFAISFIVTIVISILYLEEFSALQKSNEQLERSHEVRNQILKVQSNLIEAENSQLSYLITEDKELLIPLSQTQKNILSEIEKLKELTSDVPEQQKIIAKLKETVSLRYKVLYETADAENSSNLVIFLKNADKGKRIMKDFLSLSRKMDEVESMLIAKRKHESDWIQFVTSFYLKLILIISILFQFVSFIIITKAFKRRKIYSKILENKIKELNLSNSEMEQIAFVASHDLQEPLRKIRTFSDKLVKSYSWNLNKDGQKLLEKMATASRHMQELLNDFINYTLIVKSTEEAEVVLLEKVINDVRTELKDAIEMKKVSLKVDKLPEVVGYNHQLHLLFSNLLDNALKFSKANIPPVITISVSNNMDSEISSDKKYIKISISDNGIGFEKEFAEKIFIIFQRLHSQNSSYLGKGIGLAICKRVMLNHDGYITASGEAGVGATLNLYFPEKK
ncbi:MAG: hypothetical protein JWQ09_4623 [Segetibacter sp.]|nr:hypothetical protein [Segetibacter sp.]